MRYKNQGLRQRLLLIGFGGILSIALIEGSARLYPYWLSPQMILRLGPALREHLVTHHPPVFASVYPKWSRTFVLDQKVGYRLKPNQRVRMKPSIDHEPYWLITDSQGFRNPREYPRADIVAVGDSMTEGWGVPDEFTWVRQLEQLSGVSVANLGVRGHLMASKIATLETYGLAKHPQIALLQYFDELGYVDENGQRTAQLGPDYIQQMVQSREEELASLRTTEGLRKVFQREDSQVFSGMQAGSFFDRLRDITSSHSVTYSLIRAAGRQFLNLLLPNLAAQREARIREREIVRRPTTFSIKGHTVRLTPWGPSYLEDVALRSVSFLRQSPDWPRFQQVLLELKQSCAAQGAQLVILLVPEPFLIYLPLIASELPQGQLLGEAVRNKDAHSEVLRSFCEVQDILFIDPTRALRRAASRGEQLCFPIDSEHWNASGQRLIAQEVYRVLREKHLIQSER